ncbi:hypothetical protein V7x_17960 [Crateriforma conspicua]|uniref:Methyltransferase domain-containing protein n=2 Tax=Planctomycetaceae TaxID=126 RepID=A0A5C6FX43_9PLAN|nr:hypothetical protein V7x_17960 [Crateriforma conspicua]
MVLNLARRLKTKSSTAVNDDARMSLPRRPFPAVDDRADADDAERIAVMRGHCRIGALAGISGALFGHLVRFARRRPGRPLRVLDLSSGDDDLALRLVDTADRRGLPLQMTVLVPDRWSLDQQQQMMDRWKLNADVVCRDVFRQGLPDGFDVILCALWMHRVDDARAIRLIQSMQMAASGLLLCDWERSRTNLAAAWAASRLVSRSPALRKDAIDSVYAAFTREEFRGIVHRALARPVDVERLVPGCWVVRIDEIAVPAIVPAFA